MKLSHLLGLGAGMLALATAVVATQSDPPPGTTEMSPVEQALDSSSSSSVDTRPQAQAKLAQVAPAALQLVDYVLLDRRLRKLMQEPAMVGLSVGVVENGRITFLRGYGEVLAGSDEKVTTDTVFRWASVSKGVASTMIAKLAEQGRINLEAPVARYTATLKLPEGAEHRATVGDVLSHRLGLYRNAYDNKLEEGQDPRFLRTTLSELNLICEPGTCWSYQNIAYDAASEIVARETGEPYSTAVKQMLFNPIGMRSASFTKEALMASPHWARGHSAGKRELEITGEYYLVPAAGGVNSDIKDLTLWMLAQMGEMPDVLSPQLLQQIHAPLVETRSELSRLRKFRERLEEAWYGYGWRSYDYAGHRIVGHRGGVDGYRSLILFDPALKSGVVAMWNSNTSQPGGLEFEVMDMIYGLPRRDWLQVDAVEPAVSESEMPANGGDPQASAS